MLLLVILIAAFLIQLNKTCSDKRKLLALIALGVILLISYSDLIWLVKFYQLPFHPSDPFNYYIDVRDRVLREVLQIESSNKIYFVVNWILDSTYPDSQVFISFILKTCNALVFMTTYLLATRHFEKINKIDYLILFNPYTIMTINRNVRDMYIILFVLMILIGIGCVKNNKLNLFWTFFAAVMLFLVRPILLLPLFLVFMFMNIKKMKAWQSITIVLVCVYVVATNLEEIFIRVARQTISAIQYIGEDVTEFIPLLSGQISFGIIKTLVIRLVIGFISFLFTPHPVNYISSWLSEMDAIGQYSIYTGFDNVLVCMGSLFNYLLVIPLLMTLISKEKLKKVNQPLLLFAALFIILYVVSYLGVTDIRNRNTAYFFMILTMLYSDIDPEFTKRGYLYTFFLFCVIFIVS